MGLMNKLSMMSSGRSADFGIKSPRQTYESWARASGFRVRTSGKSVLELTGDLQLANTLDQLRFASARRIMRPAISKALTPIAAAARKKSHSKRISKLISKKVIKVRKSGMVKGKVYVRPGTERGIDETITLEGKEVGFEVVGNLQEFGTEKAAARPFLRPAMAENKSTAMQIMRVSAWAQLKKETARAKLRGKSL